MSSINLQVQGMTCGACVRHVSQALQPVAGVGAVDIDLQNGRVTVEGNPDSSSLIAALDQAGFPAQVTSGAIESTAPAKGCGCGCR